MLTINVQNKCIFIFHDHLQCLLPHNTLELWLRHEDLLPKICRMQCIFRGRIVTFIPQDYIYTLFQIMKSVKVSIEEMGLNIVLIEKAIGNIELIIHDIWDCIVWSQLTVV